jgi:SagB-type dehydrogenase family enzyme
MLANLIGRRSRSLVLTFEGGGILAYDFLSQTAAWLSSTGASILQLLAEWSDLRETVRLVAMSHPWAYAECELVRLVQFGFIVVADTPAARRDELYANNWKWGSAAGFFHFSIKYTDYLGAEETIKYLSHLKDQDVDIPLHRTNEDCTEIISLGNPSRAALMEVMRRRRSYRGFATGPAAAITKSQLGDCLFAGLGIVGFAKTDTGVLPMKLTPSAGARNPYEAYVFTYNVTGLPSGVYHYSASEHSIGRSGAQPAPSPADLLGGQYWFSGAAAIILLVAEYPRTAWKYRHPTGFRVVLIEAGHIAQNILLAATDQDLACAPTSAINDRLAESLLGLDPTAQTAVYAVALGTRGDTPTIADVVIELGPPPLEQV